LSPPAEKPHADFKLKTLPEDRHWHIYQYSTEHTLDWLLANGIQISRSALSVFLSWYCTRLQLQCINAAVPESQANYAQPDSAVSQRPSSANRHPLLIEKHDPIMWYIAQQIACTKAGVDLEYQKYRD